MKKLIFILMLALAAGAAQAQVKFETKSTDAVREMAVKTGKLVFIDLYATWCPPCRQELTRVQTDIIDRFASKEFVFLPVSRGEKREAVEAFREKTGYAFPMGLDPARTVYDRYASNYIPRNFVIDRKGKVVLATVGYDEHEFEELIRTIEKTLGN